MYIDNNIGWGKIYDTTWWGDGVINPIYWGIVYSDYALGYKIFQDIVADVDALESRVIADGGVFEAYYCTIDNMNKSLGVSPNYFSTDFLRTNIVRKYTERVEDASATLEAISCVETNINKIIM